MKRCKVCKVSLISPYAKFCNKIACREKQKELASRKRKKVRRGPKFNKEAREYRNDNLDRINANARKNHKKKKNTPKFKAMEKKRNKKAHKRLQKIPSVRAANVKRASKWQVAHPIKSKRNKSKSHLLRYPKPETILSRIESRARRDVIHCNLSLNDILHFKDLKGNWAPCYYCVLFDVMLGYKTWKPMVRLGLDRYLDSSNRRRHEKKFGYRMGNVVPACFLKHNSRKSQSTGMEYVKSFNPHFTRPDVCPIWVPSKGYKIMGGWHGV